METRTHNPIIHATTPEQFGALKDAVDKLPDMIRDQIATVSHSSVGVACELNRSIISRDGRNGIKAIIPNTTTQIQSFGDYIGIYADNFFFKIPAEFYKNGEQVSYHIIDIAKI